MPSHSRWNLASPGNLLPAVMFLREHGVPYESDLADFHVSPEAVELGRGMITKRQLHGLLSRFQSKVSEDFGYQSGRLYSPATMGAVGATMMDAPSLMAAVRRLDEVLARTWLSDNRVWVQRDGGIARINLATLDRVDFDRSVGLHSTVSTLVNFVRLVAGRRWSPRRVWVETPPHSFHARTGVLWDAEVHFNAPVTAIEFPSRFLGLRPTRDSNAAAGPSRDIPDTFHASVRAVVDASFGVVEETGGEVIAKAPPTLPELAEIFGTPVRTIQRRLAAEGTGYRDIVEEARFDRARLLVARGAGPADFLAMELGYASRSAFLKAFRRYTGMTPGEYRSARGREEA